MSIVITTAIIVVIFIKDNEIISYIWWNKRMNHIIALIASLDPIIKKLIIPNEAFK